MSGHDLLLRRRHEADCGLATFQALKRDWMGSYALVSRAVGVVGAREVIYRASTRQRGDVQIPESGGVYRNSFRRCGQDDGSGSMRLLITI